MKKRKFNVPFDALSEATQLRIIRQDCSDETLEIASTSIYPNIRILVVEESKNISLLLNMLLTEENDNVISALCYNPVFIQEIHNHPEKFLKSKFSKIRLRAVLSIKEQQEQK